MRNNILRLICCLLCIFQLFPIAVQAESDEASEIYNSVIAYELEKTKCTDIQQYINIGLVANAGVSAEWMAFSLSQSGNYSFERYEKALLDYLSEKEENSASTRLKYALVLMAVSDNTEYVDRIFGDSIGKQGIMSWIYGLHILNNGYESAVHNTEGVKNKILDLRLDDGGWALNGSVSDVDVTAMAIQALAPYYGEESVRTAVDEALMLLSDRQKDNGCFASYGVNNPESAAQVLVALSSLGIDCKSDERFIKNGFTLFDAMLMFKTVYGDYSHVEGGKPNTNATVQVLYACVAYKRFKSGKSPLYILDEHENVDNPDSSQIIESEETSYVNNDIPNEATGKINYKLYVSVAVCLIAVGIVAFLLVKKKGKGNVALVIAVSLVIIVLVNTLSFKTTEEYYGDTDCDKSDVIGTVTISIRCEKIASVGDSHIPTDGVILDTFECEIESGDTVYDVLTEATARNRIHLETNGSGDSVYVEGIANIYEFSYGDLSGWVFRVNGKMPSVSCSDYLLSDGDVIEWMYSLELGKDYSEVVE